MIMTNVVNLTDYEELLQHAVAQGIYVYEKDMPPRIKGLYADGFICINKSLTSTTEKYCVLAEELGHHYTTVGNILDQHDIRNRKQELIARRWAYKHVIPLTDIIIAAKALIETNRYELAEFLGVTEEFLRDTLSCYESKYGSHTKVDDCIICFSPLQVFEIQLL